MIRDEDRLIIMCGMPLRIRQMAARFAYLPETLVEHGFEKIRIETGAVEIGGPVQRSEGLVISLLNDVELGQGRVAYAQLGVEFHGNFREFGRPCDMAGPKVSKIVPGPTDVTGNRCEKSPGQIDIRLFGVDCLGLVHLCQGGLQLGDLEGITFYLGVSVPRQFSCARLIARAGIRYGIQEGDGNNKQSDYCS